MTFYTPSYLPGSNDPTGPGLHISELTSPSNTLMNGDANTGDIDTVKATSDTNAGWGIDAASNKGKDRHLEGANYSFVDGHVKWLKVSAIAPCTGTPPLRLNYSCAAPSGSNYTFAPN